MKIFAVRAVACQAYAIFTPSCGNSISIRRASYLRTASKCYTFMFVTMDPVHVFVVPLYIAELARDIHDCVPNSQCFLVKLFIMHFLLLKTALWPWLLEQRFFVLFRVIIWGLALAVWRLRSIIAQTNIILELFSEKKSIHWDGAWCIVWGGRLLNNYALVLWNQQTQTPCTKIVRIPWCCKTWQQISPML